jgi:hypothetical protein
LPLWLISTSGLWAGLDRNAHWVVGRLSGQAAAPSGKLSPSWLPLLDHDESVVQAKLVHVGTKYDLPITELRSSIPIDEVISMALSGNNSH